MNDESSEQLDRFATEYLLDGLAPEDRADFERRLGEDQAAREALADAVELIAAVVAAEDASNVPAPRSSRRRRRRWPLAVAAGAVAMAACLLLLLSWRSMNRPVPEGGPADGRMVAAEPGAQGVEAGLAAAWLLARGQLAAEYGMLPAEDVIAPAEVNVEAEQPATLEPPSWMLAALIEMQRAETPETNEALD